MPCHLWQFATESRTPPHDNVADDSKTTPVEYCAVRRSVGGEPIAHKFFESPSADALWLVDNNFCDHVLFDVKPHCRYETLNVAHASESLPIDGATLCVLQS
ncbi:hypothetical protein TNCV_1418131 [Trichonephila clavipes]|nr:hypothetical protein TNCV_1418131 [Trichonephila clavipes]